MALLCPPLFAKASGTNQHSAISFSGPCLLKFGDDGHWADPDLAEDQWIKTEAPKSWQAGIDPFFRQNVGWYRWHVTVPESADWAEPAICLGSISDACEVYFNGERIGGMGRMSPEFARGSEAPLLLRIPKRLIRFTDDNVIAVRIERFVFEGGILRGPLLVGDLSQLQTIVAPIQLRVWYAEAITLTILFVSFVYSLMLHICGARERVYLNLAVMGLITFAAYSVESRPVFLWTGPTAWRRQIMLVTMAILPWLWYRFLSDFYGTHRSSEAERSLVVATVVIALGLTQLHWLYYFAWAWLVVFLCVSTVCMQWAFQAARRGRDESTPMLVGLVAFFLLVTVELFDIGGVSSSLSIRTSVFGVAVFYFCGMLAMTLRFQRIRVQANAAMSAVFTAQDNERKRVARELHDGVVQSLAAVQLRLQRLASRVSGIDLDSKDQFESAIEAVKRTGDEVRRLSHDLRPEILERVGFVAAIESYAATMSSLHDVEVSISADGVNSLSPNIRDNLYRILQESLANSMKHAHATAIRVILERLGDDIRMQVVDNGRGYDTTSDSGRLGVGLNTIRERVELAGGRVEFCSEIDNGTTVTVLMPENGQR